VNITRPLQWAAHRLAADWARTQEHSVGGMLQLGVRYFDLRLSARGPTKELWISHGLYSIPFARVIEDVAQFFGTHVALWPGSHDVGRPAAFGDLSAHREVIVLDVQRISGVQAGHGSAKIHHEFFKLLEPLRPVLLKEGQSERTPLGELWDSSSRVVVLYPDALACAVHKPLVLPRVSDHIRSQWFDKNAAAPLLAHLHDELMKRRNDMASKWAHSDGACSPSELAGPLHVLQAVLTPSSGDFARMLLSPMPSTARNIEHFAKEMNGKALTLWSRHKIVPEGPEFAHSGPRPRHLALDGRNILMLDFFAQGRDADTGLDSVQLCVLVNALRYGSPRGSSTPPPAPVCPSRIVGTSDAVAPSTPLPQDAAALREVAVRMTPSAACQPAVAGRDCPPTPLQECDRDDGEDVQPPSMARLGSDVRPML
jgi:hypothetical protein